MIARTGWLVLSVFSVGCAAGAPSGFVMGLEGGANGIFEGCAVAASREDIIHIVLTDARDPVGTVEFGLTVRDASAQKIELVWVHPFSFAAPRWREPGYGYGVIFVRPDLRYELHEGVVEIEQLTDPHVIGTFSASAPYAFTGPDTTSSELRPKPSEPLKVSGRFVAPRDERYSSWKYRSPERFDEPLPVRPDTCVSPE